MKYNIANSITIFNILKGGIALLESIDTIMTGVSMPFICLLELVAMLYFYRSHDFVSDMNISTEENTCSSRIGTQWQIIPVIMLVSMQTSVLLTLKLILHSHI